MFVVYPCLLPLNNLLNQFPANFFLISKKRILLIKEKQGKYKEFTVVNEGKRNIKTEAAPNLF